MGLRRGKYNQYLCLQRIINEFEDMTTKYGLIDGDFRSEREIKIFYNSFRYLIKKLKKPIRVSLKNKRIYLIKNVENY